MGVGPHRIGVVGARYAPIVDVPLQRQAPAIVVVLGYHVNAEQCARNVGGRAECGRVPTHQPGADVVGAPRQAFAGNNFCCGVFDRDGPGGRIADAFLVGVAVVSDDCDVKDRDGHSLYPNKLTCAFSWSTPAMSAAEDWSFPSRSMRPWGQPSLSRL